MGLCTARRVQIRPRVATPQIYYEDEESQVSSADEDVGEAEYTRPRAVAYQPRPRALATSSRDRDLLNPSKTPPVQTIRNYNKVNDDGSFTFGYEAADGSFKEETRGTDCVVRGKYGYVDPDGNKREFTYVSGNPCDPNAPKEDDDDLPEKQEADDLSGPANYPSVRPRPNYPKATTARPHPTTIFQTEYALEDDEASQELKEEEEANVLIRPTPSYRTRPRQNYLQVAPVQGESLYTLDSPRSSSTARPTTSLYRLTTSAPRYQSLSSPTLARHPSTPTYRTVESSTVAAARPQQVAITPRPHVAQVAAAYASPSSTERPGVVYSRQRSTVAPSSADLHLNFAAELERYVNTVPATVTARPAQAKPVKSEPIYQSELVYDPSSGQYNTQLYQNLPQTLGDFRVNHKLQPYVATQPQHVLGLQAQQRPAPNQPQETIYRQQQADQLLQSQQLFAQQQRRQQQQQQQLQQQQQQPQYRPAASQKQQQNYYYALAPSSGSRNAGPLSIGQIDQFLRGSTAQF